MFELKKEPIGHHSSSVAQKRDSGNYGFELVDNRSPRTLQRAAVTKKKPAFKKAKKVAKPAKPGKKKTATPNLTRVGGKPAVGAIILYKGQSGAFKKQGASASGKPSHAQTDINGYTAAYGDISSTGVSTQVNAITMNQNQTLVAYERGHILPKQAGGSGGANNIFWQNAGENTAFNWRYFENTATNHLKTGTGEKYYQVSFF
ncbi:hypothetical protein [Reichenbachiella sp.]|uniref:hypothetical protein n=1 Tax=Reichenbachiella sp. TaxID=2184521 RepID=UPI003BB10BA0